MKKLRRRYFAIQLDDNESEINGCILSIVTIDSEMRNFLKDDLAKIVMDKKVIEVLRGWRADKLLKHQIEILNDSETGREYFDSYLLTATFFDQDDLFEYDAYFSLTEVTII